MSNSPSINTTAIGTRGLFAVSPLYPLSLPSLHLGRVFALQSLSTENQTKCQQYKPPRPTVLSQLTLPGLGASHAAY